MYFADRFKNCALAALPFALLVSVLHFLVAPLPGGLGAFWAGMGLLGLGLALFISGADLGIMPIGRKVGSDLALRRNLPLLFGLCLAAVFFITLAEPNTNLVTDWMEYGGAHGLPPAVTIGLGAGLFAAGAAARIVLQVSLRLVLLAAYVPALGLVALCSPHFPGLPLGAGAAAAGPVAVPFVMALGIGMAAVRGGSKAGEDSFGLVGLSVIGSIMAISLVASSFPEARPPLLGEERAAALSAHFVRMIPDAFREAGLSLLPLLALLMLFGSALFELSRLQVIRLTKGLFYAFAGLFLFFLGLRLGASHAGAALGAGLAGGGGAGLIFVLAALLGVLASLAEPTVLVFRSMADEVSGGQIHRGHLRAVLGLSAACATVLTLLCVYQRISLWHILLPGYALALALAWACPKMFTALAVDSGGALAGPFTCSFMLLFASGAAEALGADAVSAFGLMALLALMPLIFIQILGIMFERRRRARVEEKNEG